MTKQLLIMRHAKSSWSDDSLSDHDRPLNSRGLKDGVRMAFALNEQNLVPDLILSSSALRAMTTAKLMQENLSCSDLQLETFEDLYHAEPRTYLEYCSRLADQYSRPLLVGHNPGMESLVSGFAGAWETMPTAAVAYVELAIESWNDLDLDSPRARSCQIMRPRELDIA